MASGSSSPRPHRPPAVTSQCLQHRPENIAPAETLARRKTSWECVFGSRGGGRGHSLQRHITQLDDHITE